MPATLMHVVLCRYGTPDAAVDALLKVVPWNSVGYVAFYGNPKTNRSKLRYEVYKKLTSIAEYLDMSNCIRATNTGLVGVGTYMKR